jgi:hypothetical protein
MLDMLEIQRHSRTSNCALHLLHYLLVRRACSTNNACVILITANAGAT